MYIYHMKTKLLLFSALAFIMLCFNGCTPDEKCVDFTDWRGLKIRGKIKTMVTETYKGLEVSKFNDQAPHPMLDYYRSECNVDINGHITNQVFYDSNGLFQTIYYNYDDKHRETKMTVYDKYKNILAIEYRKYNEKEGQVESSVFKLDDQMHEIFVRKEVFSFNEKCHRIKASVYDSESKLLNETVSKRDDSGFLIEEIVTQSAGFDYNITNQFENDNFGNWIAKKVVLNGEWRGQNLKDFISDRANSVYTYDSQGNWLTWQEYLNSEPSRFTVRTFTYW